MQTLAELLQGGRPILGCFAFLPCPAAVEILALGGFDFAMIDREHAPKDWACVENMLRAAEARNMPALVRVSRSDRTEILHALECGADGIVVPGIESPEQLRAAVEAMRFAPRGARGSCPLARSSSYGAIDYADFCERQDQDRRLLVLIESPEAVVRTGEIVAAGGSDVLYMLGRSDIAAALGHPGQPNHPDVLRLADDFLSRVVAARPDAVRGMGIYGPEEIARWYGKGCRFFWLGADVSLLLNAAKQATQAMRAAAAPPGH